jgi:hypothetical protein
MASWGLRGYTNGMKKRLTDTNPYLFDPERRRLITTGKRPSRE